MAAGDAACWRCKYFQHDPDRDDDTGECHRYPRVGTFADDDEVCFGWPAVEWLDWCGEFREEDR